MGRAFEVRKVSMAKTAAAKSKIYARYGKEIYMAAKSNPDPETNQLLKRTIERAKREQVTADVIKRAIDKAKGGVDENYYTKIYEGFGPEGAMIIIDCLTDNDNRTIAEIRTAFKKTDQKIGISGSVLHQFENLAVFAIKASEDEVLELVLENDLNITDIETQDELTTIYANTNEYATVRDVLTNKDYELIVDEIAYIPLNTIEITNPENMDTFKKLIDMLEVSDDVQNIYHNVKGIE